MPPLSRSNGKLSRPFVGLHRKSLIFRGFSPKRFLSDRRWFAMTTLRMVPGFQAAPYNYSTSVGALA
jgi:hypothetical protein